MHIVAHVHVYNVCIYISKHSICVVNAHSHAACWKIHASYSCIYPYTMIYIDGEKKDKRMNYILGLNVCFVLIFNPQKTVLHILNSHNEFMRKLKEMHRFADRKIKFMGYYLSAHSIYGMAGQP